MTQTTRETQGAHLFGVTGKCLFCKAKQSDVLHTMTPEQQKKYLADTFANSVMPLIDTVVRKRCEQWVEELYTAIKGKSDDN